MNTIMEVEYTDPFAQIYDNRLKSKLDFYNITIEYEPDMEQYAKIEIGLDISLIAPTDITYNIIELSEILIEYENEIEHDDTILTIIIQHNIESINDYIKVLETILEYVDETQIEYLATKININYKDII